MPVLATDRYEIDYSDDGAGRPVILVHSSACGNRQWRNLIAELKDRYRVIAVNLFGYGGTTPWPKEVPQRLEDQASLVTALADMAGEPVRLVGHSYGGAIVMKAALADPKSVGKVVLIEPNPFSLLERHGRHDAYGEVRELREFVKQQAAAGNWAAVSKRFADYWNGPGSYAAMPPERRARFIEMVKPNLHEWDSVMADQMPVEAFAPFADRTLLVVARDTKRPIREIAEILTARLPALRVHALAEGGHMAVLNRPELINPVVARFLDERE